MFDILFGWPKASKCKRTIKRARCRLRILKNKRQAIATQSRKDLAELLQYGHEEIAIKRVEQLIKDEIMVAAYELLDHFCEVILKKLCFIRRHKECPDDINEAVSSLIFASARCGDLPELYVLRKLFGQRYGEKFVMAAVELFSGNLVNKQVIENLSVKSVPDYVKYRVVDEIARDNCIQPKVLALQYQPDLHQSQVKDYEGYQLVEQAREISETSGESKINPSEDEEIERDIICADSSMSNTSDNFSVPESCVTDETSALVSIVQQYPMPKGVEKVEDSPEIISFSASDLENKGDAMALVPSSDILSLPPYAEAMVDYADEEIKGCYFSLPEDGTEIDMDQDESASEKSSIRSSRKSKGAPKKRPRRRSTLLENQCLMDKGYTVYYHKQMRSPSAHKHSYPQKRLKQYSSPEKDKGLQFSHCKGSAKSISLELDMCDCSLDKPCYCCCVYNVQDCMELVTIPQKPNTEGDYSGTLGDHLLITYPDYHSGKPNSEIKLESSLVTYAFPSVSNQRNSGSLTITQTSAQYSRALSMPLEWHKSREEKILRTYSYSPQQQPKHVHPKLPEYEDVYAMFIALKRERLEGNKK